uniref:Uncharacterized protein n=1 Tax=Caenorhabditis japonica TaxID=281687 RepID=A0A8R1DGQ8_CAEJA
MRHHTFILILSISSQLSHCQTTPPIVHEFEFVPIGKDVSTSSPPPSPAPAPEKPLPKSVGKVVSTRVFTEDGIKYTEIVRNTPSGGTQVAHIQGNVKPSLLPVPVPDLSKVMKRLQSAIAARLDVSREDPLGSLPSKEREE